MVARVRGAESREIRKHCVMFTCDTQQRTVGDSGMAATVSGRSLQRATESWPVHLPVAFANTGNYVIMKDVRRVIVFCTREPRHLDTLVRSPEVHVTMLTLHAGWSGCDMRKCQDINTSDYLSKEMNRCLPHVVTSSTPNVKT